MPAPRKLVQPASNGMPPPPPRGTMGPPPPPPPKFNSSITVPDADDKRNVLNKPKSETVPDTLSKLMEYGEEDDEPDEAGEDSCKSFSSMAVAPKPFWAV